jgi:hypothetical protein
VWLVSLRWSSCQSDLTDDRIVDGRDLLYVLSAWNAVGTMADVNGDGVVNGADMALVLADWGLCR